MTNEIDLSPTVAVAWGLRGRSHKGPKPGLSVAGIVAAGIGAADADGLAAVSMSRVATDLGTAPMSLYRHVAGKDELLALMVDTAWGPPPADPVDGWRAGLSRWAWALRAGYQRHPWILQIPIGGLPTLPNEVAWFEEGLRCLADTGLEENEKASGILLVSGYTRNAAMIDAQVGAAIMASGKTPDEWMAAHARTLTLLADPQRFPALAKFVAAGVFEQADPPDDEFAFGLDRVLDGLAALINTRA